MPVFLSFAKRVGDYTWASRIVACMLIDHWAKGKEGWREGGGEGGRREEQMGA